MLHYITPSTHRVGPLCIALFRDNGTYSAIFQAPPNAVDFFDLVN